MPGLLKPTIPGGRGWRVVADGLFMVAVGLVLPARQFQLIPVWAWELAMAVVGVLVIVVAYFPRYGLRLALSLLVPLVLGVRAVAVLTAGDPELAIASVVWVLLALHIVAALAPGQEVKP